MYSRSKTPVDPTKDIWPSWRYSPDGEGRVFNAPEEVPFGWVRRVPLAIEEVPVAPLNRLELVSKLEALGVTINPIWGLAQLKKELDDRSSSR